MESELDERSIAGPSKITQDIQACSQAQEDELMALESILQPHELQLRRAAQGQLRRLTLVLAPRLPAPTLVKVKVRDTAPLKRPTKEDHPVKAAPQADEAPSAVAPINQLAAPSSPNAAPVAASTPATRGRRRNHRRRKESQAASSETSAALPTPARESSQHQRQQHEPTAEPIATPPPPPDPPSLASEPTIETLTLSHLPPLTLTLQLPPLYPLHQPPRLDSLRASWLTRAQALWLAAQLRQQWEDSRAEILYTWSEWLLTGLWDQDQGGPFLHTSASTSPFLSLAGDATLPALLARHEVNATRSDFEGQRFGCGICLEERSGQRCARLARCGHVFCGDCLSAYLGAMIREGLHRQAVCCPDPACTSARIARERKGEAVRNVGEQEEDGITEEELRELVGEEAVKRLKWLRVKAEAEADPTAQHCPRKGCSGLARLDKAEVGTPYESMRLCPKCTYCWCAYCEAVWHRGQTCKLNASSALVEEYKSYAEGSDDRVQMERRFGKANLERLVRAFEEQKANEAWLEGNSVKCPCCGVRIERSEGCAHLTCANCSTHMCWNCSKRLDPRDPYKHYNVPGQPCYGRLFPGQPGMMYEGQHQGPIIPGQDLALDEMLAWELAVE